MNKAEIEVFNFDAYLVTRGGDAVYDADRGAFADGLLIAVVSTQS